MNVPTMFLAKSDVELLYIWYNATLEGKAIIVLLVIFSIFAWSVMASKAMQMRRASRMNDYFNDEFEKQKNVLSIAERNVEVEGCPNYNLYKAGATEVQARLAASKKPGEL